MSGEWKVASRRWINCETFIVCIDDLVAVRKVNLERAVSIEKNQTLPGLELTFRDDFEPLEIDYLEESHRDQVFDAIWGEIKKMGGA